MPITRKNTGKILGLIFLSAFALVFILLVVTWFAAPVYIKNNLSDYVAEKSDGLYRLSYNDVEIGWTPFSIKINDVNLQPDDAIAQKIITNSADRIVISFRASQFQLNNIQLKSLLRDKNLLAKNMRIIDPEVRLFGEKLFIQDSTETFDHAVQILQPLFNQWLRKMKIDKIELVNAKYGLSKTIGESAFFSKANNISVDIINFRTDSSLIFNSNQFLKTDDILVRMNNFHYQLSDSLHVISIDTLLYSLKTSDISASGFHLSAGQTSANKNIYNVNVPHLRLKSKNIANLNFKDSLNIRFLKFEEPQIKFYQKANPQKLHVEDINNFDLYPLIKSDFIKIEIDTFLLSDANMEIYRQPDLRSYQHRFNSLNIRLNKFLIDSTSAKTREKLLHADDLEMSVSGYHLRLEDNQHDFRADSLVVSTFTNSLGIRNVHISPSKSTGKKPRTEVNITSHKLFIEGVDFKKLYHTRTLPTAKIEILQPNVSLLYHQEMEKPQKQQDAGLLFDMVSAYLEGVYSNLVYINNGKLNIKNLYNKNLRGYFETRFSFSLTDFSLDSASVQQTDKFFYATGFDLRFADYQMKLVDDLHKLNVDSFTISSMNQSVQINNLHLQPIIKNITALKMRKFNRSELFNIFVPKINLQKIDLRNAFFHNKLRISNFTISNPEIYFENFGSIRAGREKKEPTEFYDLLFNYLTDFDIDKITVPDGEITWVNHTRKGRTTSFDNEFSATLEGFKLNQGELDKKRLLFSDNFNISIKDQLFQLSDSVHILRAGEINLSSAKSSIAIKDAVLYPAIASEHYHDLTTTFQVSIPELKISDVDFSEAYFSRNLKLNELDINAPKFQVYSQPGAFKSLELRKYNLPLPAFIHSLELKEFKINNGEVMTFETRGINHWALSNFKVDLSIPGMKIKNDENKQSEISTSNLQLSIFDFYSPIGKTHHLQAGEIHFNRQQKTLEIKQLQTTPIKTADNLNRFTINAPSIHFSGFDFNEALEKNNFEFNDIIIQTPNIRVEINDSVRDDKIDFLQTLDLYPYAEPFVNRIQVKNLSLNDAEINFNWFRKQLIDRKINLTFSDILIAENQPPANLLNSSEFEISTTNLRTTDKNHFYEFTADTLVYNSSSHRILFKKLAANPLVDRAEMPRLKHHQTDVIQAKIDFIELQQIDEKRWLQNNTLDAELVYIGPAMVDIFRNKRYPFNQQQRPSWPQDLIRNIKQPFVFDSVVLAPSYLKYSELTGITDSPGFVEFNNLSFKAGKISNIYSLVKQFKHFKIDASAELYDQSVLSARFNFDLTSDNYYHTVSGSLAQMEMQPFNNIIEKSAPVSIENGTINRLDFNFSLNKNRAVGELYFGYKDFRISLLDYSNDEVTKSKLASFWANTMVLNSDTKEAEKLPPVDLSYTRDEKRSIINYWWKTIYSGVQKTLGIEPKN